MQPVTACAAQVSPTGLVTVPSAFTFSTCGVTGPQLPETSVKVSRYDAPRVAQGFAMFAEGLPPFGAVPFPPQARMIVRGAAR
jgi:hypothetical protein